MKYALGQDQVDFEKRINFDHLRDERTAAVRRQMKKHNLDGLLVWRDENVRYLTSFRSLMLQYRSSTQCGALFTKNGDLVLFASGGEVARVRNTMPWIKEVCPIPMLEEKGLVDHFVSNELKRLLHEHGVLDGRIGLDAMTFHQHESYSRLLSTVQFVDGNQPMVKARMIKNSEEIAILEEATAIADAIVQKGIESVKVGRREYQVAGDVLQALYYLGGEYPHLANPFVSSGERMSPPTRFATDKIIRYGDIVFIDIGSCWNGYFGDVGRTTVCGLPSRRQREIYTAVYESLMYSIKHMTVDRTTDEVAESCREKASEYGFADNLLFLFIGHGIGISPNEPPYVGEPIPGAEVVKLEPGMVFAMEPLIWVPDVRGGGGVRIEDMVLVTDSGPRILSRAPYEHKLMSK